MTKIQEPSTINSFTQCIASYEKLAIAIKIYGVSAKEFIDTFLKLRKALRLQNARQTVYWFLYGVKQ